MFPPKQEGGGQSINEFPVAQMGTRDASSTVGWTCLMHFLFSVFPVAAADSWDYQEYNGPMSTREILEEAGQLEAANLEEASSDRHVKEELRKLPASRRTHNAKPWTVFLGLQGHV